MPRRRHVLGFNERQQRIRKSAIAVKSVSSAIWALAITLTGMTTVPHTPAAQQTTQLTPAELVTIGGSSDLANRLTTDSDPERASTSFFIGGVLIAEDGEPLPDSTVQVSLDPGLEEFHAILSSGAPGYMLPLAVAVTGEAGSFRLNIPALKDTSAYLSDAGEVQLVFTSFSRDHALLFRLQAVLPNQPGTAATAAIVDQRVYPAVAVQRASEASPADPSAISVTDLTLTASTGASASIQDIDPAEECFRATDGLPLQNWVWIQPADDDPHHPWQVFPDYALLQRLWTEDNSEATFNWDSSDETTITAGIDFAYKGELLKGGFTASMLERHNMGKTFSVGNNEQKWAEAEYAFQWAELGCHIGGGVLIRADVFEFRPVGPSGGDRFLAGLGVTCGGPQWTVDIHVETRFGFGTANTYSAHMSTFGASLDVQQVHTEFHELIITPTDDAASICGQDNFPAQTAVIKEV